MFAPYIRPSPPPSPRTGPRPCTARLLADRRLHRAFQHLHACGPRTVGHCVAELLDNLEADPAALDAMLTWQQLDPDVVAAVGGRDFPRLSLRVVPLP
jgi:hypothetical protein